MLTFYRLTVVLLAIGILSGCSNSVPLGPTNPASWTGATAPSGNSTTTPTTPTSPAPAPPATTPPATPPPAAIAYAPDLAPIFNSSCVPCHGGRSPAARYSMATYPGVMAAVTPRIASSPLVLVTQPGGVMYAFLSGDRATQSAMIKTWVINGAPQSR